MKKLFVIPAIVCTALGGVAFAADAPKSSAPPEKIICLQRNQIDGWGARDNHSLVVNDIYGKKYLLTLSGWCQDFDVSMGISFHSVIGNPAMCLARGDYVVPHGGAALPSPGTRCMITGIERYTPEMEKAYHEAKEAARTAR